MISKFISSHWATFALVTSLMLATLSGVIIWPPNKTEVAAPPPEKQIIDHKNGVYWFPWTGREYSRQLSEFRGKNPDLELIGATGEVGSSLGGSVGMVGYHVYFREKN